MKKDLKQFLPSISIPITPNPLRDMKEIIENAVPPLDIKNYKASNSKFGLGQTQGTKGTARGIKFDSYWEFAFYIYQTDIQGHICTRNTLDSFTYTNENGQLSRFFPDFKVDGMYYEVKGRFRPNDLLKKEATMGSVTFIDKDDMAPIIKEVNKFRPDWRDEYLTISTGGIKYGKRN